jgi:hypothetical protein
LNGVALAASVAAARQTPRLDAFKQLRIRRPFDLEESGRALSQPAEAVVDKNISARDLRLEFDDRCSARRHQGRLHIAQGFGCAFRMDLVENFADDMEARDMVRPGMPKKIRMVSPTLAFSARSLASDPALPLNTTKSGLSSSILSTAA